MERPNFKAYTNKGYEFISHMASIENRWAISRELFIQFIEINGFTAWHIHDGWVTSGFRCGGDILLNGEIKITWIIEHAGYSHVFRCPEVGEKMIIIKDSPDVVKLDPLDIYCYNVIAKPSNSLFGFTNYNHIELKLIDVKQVIFNKDKNEYEFYIKKRKRLFGLI